MTPDKLLAKQEGFVSHVYKDHLGYWTIGHGIMVDKRKGGGLTEEESLWILRRRLKEKGLELDKHIPWWRDLTPTRRSVLLSMTYQMGLSGLLKFRNTLAAMERGDYARAAKGMRASLWAKQTPGRAERMARAMENGRFT